ncbi:catalase [Robbsia sp. Bb-Pol-6]|uniref:Catalase n=1 Tax=Robbsia betulipollinis TaxID=2981849 RepID=A0ABT3ZKR1_9BURK|nr:catalase [Robbsia betulipollinis]MCY0387042.1 catalase [Robbsia betulipollinis]
MFKTKKITALVCLAFLSASAAHAADLTRDNGAPVGDNQNSQTAGPGGPVLLQDSNLIEKLQRFDRERIPERVVHARGTGAFGNFVEEADLSDLTRANVFEAGKTTPVFVRFSTVINSGGSPEEARDPRGFSVKFYTEQGNWDLVGNNMPIFFIRDAIKFPDFVHSLKPDPVTNLQDPNRMFDFFSHSPESTAMLTWLYSNRGTPASYRKMDGFGVHAFKLVNAKGEIHYVKFHWVSRQGIENLTPAQIPVVQGKDFNNLTRDLYGALAKGDDPKWDLMIQVLKPAQLADFPYDALDDTKEWKGVPERKVGTMTLTKVPANFFESTEESAFAPSRMVPGIEPSEDRMLQGRLFSYADTQIYRVGTNYMQLPINRPRVPVTNNHQAGELADSKKEGSINYDPTGLQDLKQNPEYRMTQLPLTGTTQQRAIAKKMEFVQAGERYRSLSASDKHDLVANLVTDMSQITNEENEYTELSYFYKADPEFGTRVAKGLKADVSRVQAMAAKLEG